MPIIALRTRHDVNRDPIRDPFLILLEFLEDGQLVEDTLRVAINNEDIVYGGETYTRAAIQVSIPSTQDTDQSASMQISNVDRVIGQALDKCRKRINVRMLVVDSSDLSADPIIDTKNLMVVPSASGNTETITIRLGPRADQQEPVPFQRTTRQYFPGVWIA